MASTPAKSCCPAFAEERIFLLACGDPARGRLGLHLAPFDGWGSIQAIMGSSEQKSLPVQPGSLVAGKYRIERLLGSGGMGVVAEAIHVELNQRVAVKFVTELTDDNVARFLREARAAAQIRNEHVVNVTDVGKAWCIGISNPRISS